MSHYGTTPDHRWSFKHIMMSPFGRTIVSLALSVAGIVVLTIVLVSLSTLHALTAALIYIIPIVVSATTFGRWPGLLCASLAFLAVNYFFVPPYGTLWVSSLEDVIRLGIFFGVALVVSELASRAQARAVAAQERTAQLNMLYALSQSISAEVDLARIIPTICRTTQELLQLENCTVERQDSSATEQAAPFSTNRETILPIVGSDQCTLGYMRYRQRAERPAMSKLDHETLHTIAIQTALVIERARLVHDAARAQTLAESDRLKTALLSSVSHDLRTPLAVIKGAVSGLLDTSIKLHDDDRYELLTAIEAETDRLNRFVSDLLEMTQIEAGYFPPSTSLHEPSETIRSIVAQLRPRLGQHPIALTLDEDLPLVRFRYGHLERILTNLIENAVLYTPPTAPIELRAYRQGQTVHIEVNDSGAGIPNEFADRIFEKFVRGREPERYAHGSGLGLAICKGLVEAQGGRIWVESRTGGGASFRFTIPVVGAEGDHATAIVDR